MALHLLETVVKYQPMLPAVGDDYSAKIAGFSRQNSKNSTKSIQEPHRRACVHELQDQVRRLLSQMRVAVIYGGDKSVDGSVLYSSRNPRSWKSYKSVAEDIANSLQRLGCENVMLVPDDMHLCDRLRDNGIHFAWLNTSGVQGYCAVSHAPAILEMLGVPYIGHEPLTAGILDSKHIFKRQLIAAGLPTGRFITWHGAQGPLKPFENLRFLKEFEGYSGPFIAKPVSGRASLNVRFVEDIYGLPAAAESVFAETQNHVLIEEYLAGREFCVAVSGPVIARSGVFTRLERPFTFAHVERILDEDERIFTSMDKRPITEKRVRPLDPASESETITQLDRLASQVFNELELEALVRLDVRANAEGYLYVLEANPKPDLKSPTKDGVTSLIVEGLTHIGMSYDDLILSLVADRIDILLNQRRGSVDHLVQLLTVFEA